MHQSDTESIGPTQLPLIRLSLVQPLVAEVERRGVVIHDLLNGFELSRDAIFASELFVPAQVMYSLLEALAQAAEDPFLTVTIGEQLDLTNWPVFTEAVAGASSVGDFFNRFTIMAVDHATSIKYQLITDGSHALFKARREFTPSLVPAQADAFYAGLIVNIFRHAIGLNWHPEEITVTVCDLRAVPGHYHGMRLQQGDKSGSSLRFPMPWLLLPFSRKSTQREDQGDFTAPPRALLSAIRESLKPYLHLPDLSVGRAAEICGFKERVLRRKLHDAGTSLSQEIARLREHKARQLLQESNSSVSDIAESLGFSSQSIFSRWFKQRTGDSPMQFREKHRA